ncbi:MAG: alkaline phosphatase family protein [Gemmatimonadales bacterium]
MTRAGLAIIAAGALGCAASGPPATDQPEPAARRAILVSFDALSEERARNTVDHGSIPNFLELFAEASCADGARPMWPSVTAASHAALWTGVYGDVNGVVANNQAPLPWSEFSLTDLRSGFEARELRAEPIWITAARAGRRVVGHHVTQAGEPGRWRPEGGRETDGVRRDSAALADPDLFLANGYSGGPDARILSRTRDSVRSASGWKSLDRLGPIGVPLREVSWSIGDDSLHALFFGSDAYREALVSPARDAARGVRVRPAPVEQAPLEGRELARHFSEPLWMGTPEGAAGVYFRLWSLAPDLSSFELLQTPRSVVRTNSAGALAEYQDAVGPFVGNPVTAVLGRTGPTLPQGGDGSAELKYLETAELQTRQFIRGSEWAWRQRRPALQAEYFSLADGLDHTWFGYVASGVPGVDPALAARIAALRNRGWALVDRRLASLLALAREGNALLVVAGDHGMRAVWRFFHVNVALRHAGLLGVDERGRPDLRRTQAITNAG